MLLTNSFPAKKYYIGAICSIYWQGCVGISITKLSCSSLNKNPLRSETWNVWSHLLTSACFYQLSTKLTELRFLYCTKVKKGVEGRRWGRGAVRMKLMGMVCSSIVGSKWFAVGIICRPVVLEEFIAVFLRAWNSTHCPICRKIFEQIHKSLSQDSNNWKL